MSDTRVLPRRRRLAKQACVAMLWGTLLTASGHVGAQEREVTDTPERFDIGLSTSEIGINSDFNGATLTVFGAIDDADSRVRQQQRYDVIVALFGPSEPIVVREKERFFGLWINRASATIQSAPITYSLASTRPLRDITTQATLSRLSLGVEAIPLDGSMTTDGSEANDNENPDPAPSREVVRFEEALRDIKQQRALYSELIAGVRFVGSSLFRADLYLPPDLPTGTHVARAYLFREGKMIRQATRQLTVTKVGFQARIDAFAAQHGVFYGFFAVFVAIVTGWLGRVMFKRD